MKYSAELIEKQLAFIQAKLQETGETCVEIVRHDSPETWNETQTAKEGVSHVEHLEHLAVLGARLDGLGIEVKFVHPRGLMISMGISGGAHQQGIGWAVIKGRRLDQAEFTKEDL